MGDDLTWGGEPVEEPELPFGQSEGDHLRDAGVARVLYNTPDKWKAAVLQAVRRLSVAGSFTSEDVREIAGDPPHHANALPAMMNALSRKKMIKQVGWTKAKRPNQHSADIRVWVGA